MNTHGLRGLGLLLLLSSTAYASQEGLRLIETAEGHRAWMTPAEIARLAQGAHKAGHCGGFMDVTDHPGRMPSFTRGLGFLEDRLPSHQATVNRITAELSATSLMASV